MSANTDLRPLLLRTAVEQWRLIRTVERLAQKIGAEGQARVVAEARYYSEKLKATLAEAGLELRSFDGETFGAGLPASPLNAAEFETNLTLVVHRTVEPAVICDGQVVQFGKVELRRLVNAPGN